MRLEYSLRTIFPACRTNGYNLAVVNRRRLLSLMFMLPLASACGKSESASTTPAGSGKHKEVKALKVGDAAPLVSFELHDGKSVSLAGLEGSFVLLYFYPKDDTPGCTTEAQRISDRHEELEELEVKVFGVSTQDAESHKDFIKRYELPFPLVVDPEGRLAAAFNVPVRMGFAARQSFLIDKKGKMLNIWRTVVPDEHASQVVAAVRNAAAK